MERVMKIDRFVSVTAPLYNAEEFVVSYIEDTIDVLNKHYTNYELVLVDDGSQDNTVGMVTSLLNQYEGIRLLRLSREFGEEIAITAGLDTVIGDYTIVMLPHMDPPTKIPELVQQCIDGSDVIFGIRRTRADEGWLTRKATALFFWYCHRILKLDLTENATQFRCMSRQAVNAIIQIKDTSRYLRLLSSFVGYAKKAIIYDPIYRGKNTRKTSFSTSLKQALTIIMENSVHPLRFVSWMGLFAATSNLIYIGYIVAIYLFKETVMEGWTTLSLQNASQFFFIAIILTALCEYTGRVLNRLQNRPLYHQMPERNSSILLVNRNRPNIVENSEPIDL